MVIHTSPHSTEYCLRCDCAILKDRLALAEKAIDAARRRLDVWTRETYMDVKQALEAYDAATKGTK
jgi:hypothetical protein